MTASRQENFHQIQIGHQRAAKRSPPFGGFFSELPIGEHETARRAEENARHPPPVRQTPARKVRGKNQQHGQKSPEQRGGDFGKSVLC